MSVRTIRAVSDGQVVRVEVDGVKVIEHPLGKEFSYEVTRADIEMLIEQAILESAEEADRIPAEAEAETEDADSDEGF